PPWEVSCGILFLSSAPTEDGENSGDARRVAGGQSRRFDAERLACNFAWQYRTVAVCEKGGDGFLPQVDFAARLLFCEDDAPLEVWGGPPRLAGAVGGDGLCEQLVALTRQCANVGLLDLDGPEAAAAAVIFDKYACIRCRDEDTLARLEDLA